MKRPAAAYGLPFIVLLAIDQATKAWARASAEGMEGRLIAVPIPGLLEIKLTYNHGIAFGLFQGAGWLLSPIALIMAGAAAWMSFRRPAQPLINHLTLGVLSAGAIGNLIDRVWMQKVTDFIFVRAINFPVFNVADACISVAAALILIGAFQSEKKKVQPPEAPTTGSA
jgi:signal peptidase II